MANIVMIESQAEYFQELVGMVRDCKYQVQTVLDHNSALKTIQASRVQILILEWEQLCENALGLIAAIRSNHRTRRIHIIAVSSVRTPEMLAEALKATVEDYFSWPITINEIRERLLWISNHQELSV